MKLLNGLAAAACLSLGLALPTVALGQQADGTRETALTATLRMTAIDFSALSGWEEDDHAAALQAFLRHCKATGPGGPQGRDVAKTGALGIDGSALRELCHEGLAVAAGGEKAFLERGFRPVRLDERGFLTGYFEPELVGSRHRSVRFRVPLLSRPDDLVKLDDTNRPANIDPGFAFGRLLADGRIVEHPDRGAIMDGALADRGLELVWLEDPVDALYVHVQGSARIRLDDGTTMRVAYAAKTGHPYFPIGRVMIERGLAEPGTVTMDVLRGWLRDNPQEVDGVLRRNRSYIFFREVEGIAPTAGPIGAADLPLVPGRSLAVDRLLHTFGTPIFVEADLPLGAKGELEPFRRLMIADDTGSAIVGPARGDIFIGSGAAAGAVAGRIQHPARLTILVPRSIRLQNEGKP